jgi:hypothetical protein
VGLLEEGIEQGRWTPSPKEAQWLRRIHSALDELPADAEGMLEASRETYGGMYEASSYGLD